MTDLHPNRSDAAPIGVFDSGVGGLTVLRALRDELPRESFVYLGDTARLPYGTKSPSTVRAYARQAAQRLVDEGVKLLVVACNTASALAIDELRLAFAPLPVIGVVEAGARAACSVTRSGHVLVTGTDSTIEGGAYPRAMSRHREDLQIESVACPIFVALAEEGWGDGAIAEASVRRYLGPWLDGERAKPDTLVLGCTHFPALRVAIEAVCGPEFTLVDSARPTAGAVSALLAAGQSVLPAPSTPNEAQLRFMATDAPDRFARVAPIFLGEPISPDSVELVDL
jgi:glutamate racemase